MNAGANRLARGAFVAFLLAIGVVVLIALEIPSKAGAQAGEAVGRAGFRVKSVDVQGLRQMDPGPVYAIALDQQTTAMPLVDVSAIRERLLKFGWVKDARVSRRLPDTLVIDIVEREPAALWQDKQQLSLIDSEGVVLDRVPVDKMPDLPLLIGPGANAQAQALNALLADVPTLKPTRLRDQGRAASLGFEFPVGRNRRLARGRAAGQRRADPLRQDGSLVGTARPRDPSLRPAHSRQDDRPSAARAGRGNRPRNPVGRLIAAS